MGKVSSIELIALLLQVVNDMADIKAVGETWDEAWAGNVEFEITINKSNWLENGIWKVTIFNDCNEFDYIDKITSPSGAESNFDDYWDNGIEYEKYVNSRFWEALEKKLKEAPPKGSD